MYTSTHHYLHQEQNLQGYLAFDDAHRGPRPAVLVIHDWSGLNDFARKKAEMLAGLGYLGFAVDMYGNGQTGDTVDEKMALMQPLISDRDFLSARIQAALDAVIERPEVDGQRVAVIGFCFGGLCALDLARSGRNIKGVVSFHGLLNKPEDSEIKPIGAKILALHGYDDPMVKPDMVNRFCDEMTAAKADWQVHMYGHTQHAFSNPLAKDSGMGTVYNAIAEQRALQSMRQFLAEIFV